MGAEGDSDEPEQDQHRKSDQRADPNGAPIDAPSEPFTCCDGRFATHILLGFQNGGHNFSPRYALKLSSKKLPDISSKPYTQWGALLNSAYWIVTTTERLESAR